MKALTLWRPWPTAIFYLHPSIRKDVENRSWKPPDCILGKRIAIHAGSKFDSNAFEFWLKVIKPNPSQTLSLLANWKKASELTGIIGTVRVYGYTYGTKLCYSDWATGEYAWFLSEPVSLGRPIQCKGAQGLWNVPDDIHERIRAFYPAAVYE